MKVHSCCPIFSVPSNASREVRSTLKISLSLSLSLCVCVCVRERERKRKRGIDCQLLYIGRKMRASLSKSISVYSYFRVNVILSLD